MAALIAGTGTIFVDLPYVFLQVQVEAGEQPAPPHFVEKLVESQKTQYAAVIFLATTIFAVKFSFMFFFKQLLPRTKKWYMWWWRFVFALLVPSALLFMFSDFVSCPYFGEDILSKSVLSA